MWVYLVTNTRNGKRYVGITDCTLEVRWKQHVQASRRPGTRPLMQAIAKHGTESFKIEPLEECSDRTTLLEREQQLITELGTFMPCGYNATLGGEGVAGMRHSEETRRRMGESRRGERNPNWGGLSEEHRVNISRSRKGKGLGGKGTLGYKHTEDARRRISDALRLRMRSVTPVDQLDEKGDVIATYGSAQAAARAVNGRDDRILTVCRGLRKTHCGFGWRYADGAERA